MRPRLITIPFSHYCEKARWALDRADVAYVEEAHVPMFAWAPALRAGRSRTVPILVIDEERLTDSHAIVAHVHRRAPAVGLYPEGIAREVEALEARFDDKLGPAARRLAYHALMTEPRIVRELFVLEASRIEALATRALLPIMIGMMRRGLKIDDAGATRSEKQIAPVLDDVAARLAKSGGPWLFGDRFTAADLTLASLMTPLTVPPSFTDKHLCKSMMDVDAPRALVERYRETDAGRFTLRAYETERARRVT